VSREDFMTRRSIIVRMKYGKIYSTCKTPVEDEIFIQKLIGKTEERN